MRLLERASDYVKVDEFTPEDLAELGVVLRRDQLNPKGQMLLDSIMSYRNERVIERYIADNGGTQEEAERIYAAMLQYLVVCVLTQGKRTPSKVIDEMWHAFILHMKDYENFCKQYLRQIVYHSPADDDNGFKFYAIARTCAEALFGQLDPVAWPLEHKRYLRCISCSPAPLDLFQDCLLN